MKKGKRTMLIGIFVLAVGVVIALQAFVYVATAAVWGIILVHAAMNYWSAKRRLSSHQNLAP